MKKEAVPQNPTSTHQFESPLRRRYGSPEMKAIWNPLNYWLKVRDVWIANAKVQNKVGLVSRSELADLRRHRTEIDIDEIDRREFDDKHPLYTGHDVVAAIDVYGEQAPIGKRVIHQGMTSEDALSNAEMMVIHESFDLLERRLEAVLKGFAGKIEDNIDTVCMGYTHLQAAEPTTVGYRLARYAQDFLTDLQLLRKVKPMLKTKGMKGTVGTSASYEILLEGSGMSVTDFENAVMKELGLTPVTISAQTYPRKHTFLTMAVLASIGQSAHQFAADTKLLQFSDVDQAVEGRNKRDKGSSHMPWKQNPRHSETTKSLTRGLPGKMTEAWHSAAETTLERGLEDSAGKREYLSSAFIIADEALLRAEKIISGYRVKEDVVQRSLDRYMPFFTLGALLSELPKRGADRQILHEVFKECADEANDVYEMTGHNPLIDLVAAREELYGFMSAEEIREYFIEFTPNVGNAPEQCMKFLRRELRPALKTS